MTPLRRRMIDDMQLRNLAPRTIKVYVSRVGTFARHFGRSPEALGPDDVRAYLLHLVQQKHVSWTVYNQTVAALRFLYEVTLERPGVLQRIRCPKQPKRLPVVPSPEETARFFAAILSLKHRAILMTAYAAGLRISEVVALRVADVASQRMVLRVRQGKGRRDRNVMLSPRLLALLRDYWKVTRPADWLFPGDVPGRPITAGSVHGICAQAARAAGLGKHVTVHTLRHSFATHLLEAGTDIRTIQVLLGHRNLTPTAIYALLSPTAVEATRGPRDRVAPLPGGARPWPRPRSRGPTSSRNTATPSLIATASGSAASNAA